MKIYWLHLTLACCAFVGCSQQGEQSELSQDTSDSIVIDELPTLTDSSGHPEHGPHGGELVELGKETFHIEMVHDAGTVVMYVLDGSATEPVAIEAQKLIVSLKHEGEVKSFDLTADSQPEDEANKSSRFSSTSTEMVQWLEAGAEGAVILQIEGKSFTGKISHDHHDGSQQHHDH